MKFQSNRGIFLGIILFSITASTFGQFLVVPPKAEVIVPKVTGMMRAEAEKILTDLGLKVTTAEQEDPDFPDGTVLSQRPAAGKKAAAGDEVLILLSKSKGEPAPAGKKTASRIPVPDVVGKSFSNAFGQLRKLGFTNLSPQPVKSSEPKETVIGLLADAKPIDAGETIAVSSEIVVLISAGAGPAVPADGTHEVNAEPQVINLEPTSSIEINTSSLKMTGMRVPSITIDTEPLIMTGTRLESITISTQPLVMTGMRVPSITIDTQPLIMTGMRVNSITIQTDPLKMTGMRVGSITIDTDALKMTGMRDEKGGSDVKDQSKSSQQKKQADEKKKPKSPEQKTIETTLQSNRREQSAESDTSAPGGLLKKI